MMWQISMPKHQFLTWDCQKHLWRKIQPFYILETRQARYNNEEINPFSTKFSFYV